MKTSLDWNKFKLFYYIAKAGSFKATAERLNMSQSSLSRSIQDLEYQLGSKLFERKSRGIVLTSQGKHLLNATEKSFEEFSRAEMLIKEEEEELTGVLKVAIPSYLPPGWFISVMRELLREYPSLQLYIYSDDRIRSLKNEHVDVALSFCHEKSKDINYDLIYVFHLNLCASRDYIKAHGLPKRGSDLNRHNLITYGFETVSVFPNINWHLKLAQLQDKKNGPYMSMNSLSEIYQATENGFGISSLPNEYVREMEHDLVEILPGLKRPSLPLYFIYPEHLKDTQRVKILINYLKNKFTFQVNLEEKDKDQELRKKG